MAAYQRARGRQPRSFNPLVPTWARTRLKAARMMAVQIPSRISWTHGLPADLGGLHNAYDPADPTGLLLGDCTIAAVLHMLQVILFNTTGRFWTNAELSPLAVKYYSLWCGYVPGDPSTDQGGNVQTVLTKWMTDGVELPDGTLHRISGFIEVDPINEAELREAIAVCGVVDFGADIPDSYDQINPGDSWLANQGQPTGGHCFFSGAFDPAQLIMDSWGFAVPMPPAAVSQYVDEAFAILSPDWIGKTGRSPFNMSAEDIDAMMAPLRQSQAAV